MKIGYLHIGPTNHGLCRYSRLLAEEAKTQGNLTITEVSILLDKSWWQNLINLYQAGQTLSDMEVVHFQYNNALWGPSLSVLNLLIFTYSCQTLLCVTLHDIYWEQVDFQWSSLPFYFKAMYGPKALSIRFLLKRVDKAFVCTKQELDRLGSVDNICTLVKNKVTVIPHFVEKRTVQINSTEARQALKLEGKKIITLLGWIHGRKGHQLLLETLPQLPSDVMVIFAGSNTKDDDGQEFLYRLTTLANNLNVSDQLRITGYLPEQELEKYLSITDIAVCPFMTCSASGSLSTWISVSHPKIAAYQLPQIEEYNYMEPGSIHTFQPYETKALSDLLLQLLAEIKGQENTFIQNLRNRLDISKIFQIHAGHYSNIHSKCDTRRLRETSRIRNTS